MAAAAAAPYSVNLDPQVAHELAAKGAALLVLNMPQGSYFGMDHHTFVVGPKFTGVKMIPPGPHFVSYLAVSNGQTSPPTGFFLHLKPQQVEVRRWDAATETLVPMEDEDEAQRYVAGVRRYDFDQGMAPYNLPAYHTWTQLSNYITPSTISKLSPATGNISIISEGEAASLDQPRTAAEHRLVEQLKQKATLQQTDDQPAQLAVPPAGSGQEVQGTAVVEMQAATQDVDKSMDQADHQQAVQSQQQGKQEPAVPADDADATRGRCSYTPLPRLIKQAGATAAELTQLNMDKSTILQQVLSSHYNGQLEGLMGELQFAFIAFVYGQSLDAYAQWKAILLLLLGCQSAALHQGQPQFVKVLELMTAQLRQGLGAAAPAAGSAAGEVPNPFGDSLVEELLPDSFLRRMFGGFFSMLQENGSDVGPALFQAAGSLKALLHARLGWDYDVTVMGMDGGVGSDDEDGPVVVENPEDWVRL